MLRLWFFCDRYGLIWISTTLVFVLAALGNLATFLMQKHADNSTSWSFDVSYMNVAACSIYGYAIVVPLAYYFFLQYMGSNASLIRFWCMWGYSLTIFIMSSVSFCFLQRGKFHSEGFYIKNNIAQLFIPHMFSPEGEIWNGQRLNKWGALPLRLEGPWAQTLIPPHHVNSTLTKNKTMQKIPLNLRW